MVLDNVRDLRAELQQAVANCKNQVSLELALRVLQTSALQRSGAGIATPPGSAPRIARKNTMLAELEALQDKRPPTIGLDIGGTLAKMAIVHRSGLEDHAGEDAFCHHSKHADLAFGFMLNGDEYNVRFVSGETARLGQYLESATQVDTEGRTRKIVVAGGGAHKFAESMRKASNVEMVPFQEMESLVAGLDFVLRHGPPGEAFTVNAEQQVQPYQLPDDLEELFPCLLVNIGSGVSILRIDGPAEGDGACRYQRVGGTACGGKTFLGLMRRMTRAKDFREMLAMAGRGDAANVNTLVCDIYGEEGCGALGLPPQMTAAYFGKAVTQETDPTTLEADSAAALLMLVVQESVVLSRALSLLVSAQVGGEFLPLVFFVGGFLDQNEAAWQIIARTHRNLKLPPPLFLKHADFLGALGCISKSVERPQAVESL